MGWSGAGKSSLKLDRETEALLHWVSSATVTPLWSLAPAAARDEYRRTLAKTEIVPPEIGQASDVAVAGPAGWMQMRKYVPVDATRAADAAILFVHGGGCVLGDIETHDILCRTLCHDTRATVFSLDYRLAPEHPFPAAVEDTVAALMWLSHEAPALGLDPERIAVAGGRRTRGCRAARDQGSFGSPRARSSSDLSWARPARPVALAEGAC